MSKIELNDTNSGYDRSAINLNFQRIKDFLDDRVLMRNNVAGEPNTVENDIDFNGKRIYNLAAPSSPSEPARLQDVANAISSGAVLATAVNDGLLSSGDFVKLQNIDDNATQNSTDFYLLDRSHHTGTQPVASVSGLQVILDDKQATLQPGVNIKTINGSSILGSGDLFVAGGGGSSSAQAVTNLSALRSLSKLTYQFAQVTGHTTAADGGGGFYYYVSTDVTSADNAGTVIVAADGGRWYLDVTSGVVNADQFGIDATAATDVSARLQTMIDWCQDHEIKPQMRRDGRYKLSSGITIKQGKSSSDTKEYVALLDGQNCVFYPYGAITAIAVVPRCTLADQGTGRQSAYLELSNFNIDGSYASAGAQPLKIGAAGYVIYCRAWGVVSDVSITNFNTSSVLTYFKEASHIVADRLIHKWCNGTLLIECTGSGSFTGDLVFNAFQGEGTVAVPPIKLTAGVTGTAAVCQVRGIKFNQADIYGAGVVLKVQGTNHSQVGDIWFNSCQFDSNGAAAGDKVIYLEANETSDIFQVHIRDIYVAGYSGTIVYALCNSSTASIFACDISGGAINDCTPHSTWGNTMIGLNKVNQFLINDLAFEKIFAGPSPATASLIQIEDSTNVSVQGCSSYNATAIGAGIAIGGTSNKYILTGNTFDTYSNTINDYTNTVRTKVVANNIGTVLANNNLSGYLNLNNPTANLLQSLDGYQTVKPLFVTAEYTQFAAGTTPASIMTIKNGVVGIGASNGTPASGAVLDVSGTYGGLAIPAMTTAQKNAISSPRSGTHVYDTALGQTCVYNGAAWVALAAGGGSGTVTSITAGTGLSGGTITSTGTIALTSTGVSAGSYGSGSSIPTYTVNAQGQLTASGSTSVSIGAAQVTSGVLSGIPVTGASGSFTGLTSTSSTNFQTTSVNFGTASYSGIQSYYEGSYTGMFLSAALFQVATGASPTAAFQVDSNGYTYCGYTSSNGSYRLQVNGQIFATSSTIATSDGNYKENVKPLTGALDIVSELNPVTFTWKSHDVHSFQKGTTTGFIAQEVEELLRDTPYCNSIVKASECTLSDGTQERFLGIAEGNLISILTAALKELHKDHVALKALLTTKGIV